MSWQPSGGRWSAIKEAWKAGEPRYHIFNIFISSIPIWSWPGGERNYYALENKYGEQTWHSPTNLWRELFHLFFGFILTLPFIGWPMVSFSMIAVVFVSVFLEEFFTDIQDYGVTFKKCLDLMFWVSGAIISTCLSIHFFQR